MATNQEDSCLDVTNLLPELLNNLESIVDWYLMGTLLKVHERHLKSIQAQYLLSFGIERCKIETLTLWLNSLPPALLNHDHIWREIIAVLEAMNEGKQAREVKHKYFQLTDTHVLLPSAPHDAPECSKNDMKVNVNHDIVEKFNKLQARFATLVVDTMKMMEDPHYHISLKDANRFVNQRFNRFYQEPKNVDEFFNNVQNDCSCFSYFLLKELIERYFPNTLLYQCMIDYVDDFIAFASSTQLKNLIGIIKTNTSCSLLQTVKLKLDNFWDDITVERFQKFVNLLLPRDGITLSNIQVTPGCLCVSWSVTHSVIPSILEQVKEKVHIMKYLGIICLTIGATKVFDTEGRNFCSDINSAFTLAIKDNQSEPITFLCSIIDTSTPSPIISDSLLQAVESNNLEIAQNLLQFKLNINMQHPETGKTPIMIAVGNNNVPMVHLLSDYNPEFSLRDNKGQNALYLACYNQNLELVAYLLEKEIDINATDALGYTPLMLACTERDGISFDTLVLHLLLANGANPNISTNNGTTALIIASIFGYKGGVEVLLDYEADVNLTEHKGNTPLIFAAEKGNTVIVQLLLEAGANINHHNNRGHTPTDYACFSNKDDVIAILVSAGGQRGANFPYEQGNEQARRNHPLSVSALIRQVVQDPVEPNVAVKYNTEESQETEPKNNDY